MSTKDYVSLVTSGYEWICPNCDHLNVIPVIEETVECEKCKREFKVGEITHAS